MRIHSLIFVHFLEEKRPPCLETRSVYSLHYHVAPISIAMIESIVLRHVMPLYTYRDWQRLNIIEVDNVCDGGLAILDAVRRFNAKDDAVGH